MSKLSKKLREVGEASGWGLLKNAAATIEKLEKRGGELKLKSGASIVFADAPESDGASKYAGLVKQLRDEAGCHGDPAVMYKAALAIEKLEQENLDLKVETLAASESPMDYLARKLGATPSTECEDITRICATFDINTGGPTVFAWNALIRQVGRLARIVGEHEERLDGLRDVTEELFGQLDKDLHAHLREHNWEPIPPGVCAWVHPMDKGELYGKPTAQEATDVNIKNGTIENVYVGFQRGILTVNVKVMQGNTSYSCGGYNLQAPNGFCQHYIRSLLKTFYVSSLDDLKGLPCRMRLSGRIEAVGHFTEDRWFCPEMLLAGFQETPADTIPVTREWLFQALGQVSVLSDLNTLELAKQVFDKLLRLSGRSDVSRETT